MFRLADTDAGIVEISGGLRLWLIELAGTGEAVIDCMGDAMIVDGGSPKAEGSYCSHSSEALSSL